MADRGTRALPVAGRTDMTEGLQWDYSCGEDVLTAWLGLPQPCDEVRVDDSIVIRISRRTHQPVGIKVGSASRLSKWTGALNGSVARALLEKHGPAAMAIWGAKS
jgi:hypothetical protein